MRKLVNGSYVDLTPDEIFVHKAALPSLEDELNLAILQKRQEIDAEFKQACTQLKEGYTPDEVESWPEQIVEAAEFEKDDTSDTIMLNGIAAGKLITVSELADRVLLKKKAYSKLYGEALGRKYARSLVLKNLDKTSENILEQISEI